MTLRNIFAALLLLAFAAACSNEDAASEGPTSAEAEQAPTAEVTEIMTGLTMKKLANGYGRAAVPGDIAVVHYTGWLYDESAPDGRGEKFDSSVDRGETFDFPLGAGRVIKGWDEGVAGMLIGEKRELKIAPELGYGDRGAGAVIPPGATLIFEVELKDLRDPG